MPPELSTSILNANKHGRLGLILYATPGYPDVGSYFRILEYLDTLQEVSVIENTFPVPPSFSEYANAAIQNAHRIASDHLAFGDITDDMLKASKPTLCVLYEKTVEQIGFETIFTKHENAIDGFLLEWEPEHPLDAYAAAAKTYGIEFVREIEPQMTHDEIDETLDCIQRPGHIYLVTAAMTGAALFADDNIRECVSYVKRQRPDVTLSA
jgi:tryptophan synthase alpha subunit